MEQDVLTAHPQADDPVAFEPIGTATYSPEDNKLRLYPDARLDAETYARVKAAGFGWAPKQQLFVAPMWTPQRYDLLLELCGGVDDEDSTLEQRAEQRALRYEGYKRNRVRDANHYADRVEQLTGNVPLGQPILIGHHSERSARRVQKRIQSAMDNAMDHWGRAEYWKGRIPAVRRHVAWKANDGLRHRRIKTIEADQRKQQRTRDEAQRFLDAWSAKPLTRERALHITNYSHSHHCFTLAEYPRTSPEQSIYEGEMSVWSALEQGIITPEQARDLCVAQLENTIEWAERWLAHIELRLAYERELLGETGGQIADRFPVAVGGRVQVSRERTGTWLRVLRVNKANGKVNSITTTPPPGVNWTNQWKYGIETVTAYESPAEGVAEKVKQSMKQPPLVNYPGEGFRHMTMKEWNAEHSYYKGTRTKDATDTHEAYRYRSSMRAPVFISDKKVVHPPVKQAAPPPPPAEPLGFTPDDEITDDVRAQEPERKPEPVPEAHKPQELPGAERFEALRDSAKTGVQVAVADQLYPTPPDLAKRMVELAGIHAGECVLEPSAGNGNLIEAIRQVSAPVVAVEVNAGLCQILTHGMRSRDHRIAIVNEDFLSLTPNMLDGMVDTNEAPRGRQFDAVIMNPPFANASDIKHIEHALTFLRPGGRLVAICANGPRQQRRLRDELADHWEELPAGTFADAGTQANTALLVIKKHP